MSITAGVSDASFKQGVFGVDRRRRGAIAVSPSALPAAVVAAGAALVVLAGERHGVALRAPSLRAALETAILVCSLTAAVHVWSRFAQLRRVSDLLMFEALLVFSLTRAADYALPAATGLPAHLVPAPTASLGELIAAVVFTAAMRVPADWQLRRRRGLDVALVAAGLGVVGGLVVVAGAAAPGTALVAIPATALFACAAVSVTRRGARDGGRAAALLAGSLVLLGAARASAPSLTQLGPSWVSPGEGLAVLGALLMLAAILLEEREARVRLARVAAAAERRRVARDLHDGLAQDLALIAAHQAQLARAMGSEHPVALAARRALAVSRGVISDLSTAEGEPLEALAHELGCRFGVAVGVDVIGDPRLPPDVHGDVVRIAGEAIANAARHGGAQSVLVSLTRTDSGTVLRVRDDGCGRTGPAGRPADEGFGLGSIRDRAAAMGGRVTIRQPATGGTELELAMP
jgi:signal transduction histidine kinase